MKKKKRVSRQSKTGPMILAVLGILAVVGVGLAIAYRTNGATLRASDTAFTVSTHAGQHAPAFTAISGNGQPYTMTPGDGRPKAIVFYMGYG